MKTTHILSWYLQYRRVKKKKKGLKVFQLFWKLCSEMEKYIIPITAVRAEWSLTSHRSAPSQKLIGEDHTLVLQSVRLHQGKIEMSKIRKQKLYF